MLEPVESLYTSGCMAPRSGIGEGVQVRVEDLLSAVTEVLKAEPISVSVSDLARTIIEGAMAGTCEVGERGGLVRSFSCALILFSSTIILLPCNTFRIPLSVIVL